MSKTIYQSVEPILTGHIDNKNDPALREAGLYRFYLYDHAGRLAMQGTTASCSRSEAVNHVTYTHGSTGIGSTGYVMEDASRIQSPVIESVTYYDGYSLPDAFTSLKSAETQSAIVTGLATASMSRASDGTMLRSVMYYDGFGRLTEQRATGLRGRLAVTKTYYSYTDKPVKTRFTEGDVTVTTDYTYDTATDLLLSRRVYTNVGKGDYSALVASYSYDALGRVSRIRFGNSAGAVDYTRDLHGKLRTVSHPTFSQRLFYADGPGSPLYNGSVSAMMWLAPDNTSWRGYRYSYNSLGWLTKAEYGEDESLSSRRDRYTLTVGEFTENGSIRRLQRHGLKDDGKYGKIDNLHLRYDGNRLSEITEDALPVTREGANDFDYADGKSHAYRYNSSGALTRDLNRGLKSVTYDNLNRPVKLTFSSASYIDHVYAIDGTRLRTIHNTSLLTGTVVPIQKAPILRPLFTRDTVEYSGPVVYENGKVKRVMFEGGYATFDSSGVPGWHYFVCDHAGSVRTVVDMWARAEQINHYYPYGLTFADAGKAPDHQPCKFGGKELDAMYGLHFHDFHARLQIPDLGRFDRPDPLCEAKYHLSPYLFCDNDPINKIDPSGMFAEKEDAEKYARMFAYTLDDGTKVTPEVHTDDDGKFFIEMNEDGTGAYRGEGKAVRDYGKNGWPNSAFSDVFPKKMADAVCNALGYPNMAVGSLIEDAATVPGSEGKASGTTQVTKSLGKEVGSIYKATEIVGNVTIGITFTKAFLETGYYITNPPVSNKVFAKSFADVIAAAAPVIAGPPGAVFSIAYTLIDYITDGFGINYKVAIPQ